MWGGPFRPASAATLKGSPHVLLKESDRAALRVDVDVLERRRLAEPRHALHVAAERDDEPRAGGRQEATNRKDESRRTIPQQRIVRQRHLRLGHADRRRAHPELLERREIVL